MANEVDPLSGLNPQVRTHEKKPLIEEIIRSIPRDKIPSKIGDMQITEELLDDYKGHEVLLKERAKHPPHCYKAYDAFRLCLLQRIDKATCGRVMEAYKPCNNELKKAKIQRMLQHDEERRKMLAAQAKVLAEKAGQGEGAKQ